ncbi:uncharacterized protein [Amphiura filiformis]|uniref:uncharacterized protein n=1 Tax=Amphiura filiformis TaxID=82378 RepID=UPI003B210F15
MPVEMYEIHAHSSISWICCKCGLPNLSPSVFHSLSGVPLANSFSSLDDSAELSQPEEIGSPLATSSPTLNSKQKKGKGVIKHRKLKALVINCDGLYEKMPQLESLIDMHRPDVIFGTESHLNSSIFTAEITPPDFTTLRRDRTHARKGGVFIMINDDLIASECNISSDAEILGAEIHIQGHQPLIIGSFYRPPRSPSANLDQLSITLSEIQSKFKNAIVILAGDFNLADIDWSEREVKKYAIEPSKCGLLLNICHEFFLDQKVTEPTRISGATKNILDLVLTSHPNFVDSCKAVAGLSDHEAVSFTINTKPRINKKVQRKVFLFGKADMTSIQSEMTDFQHYFLDSDPSSRSVQENWDMFTDELKSVMDNHIPSKTSCSDHKSPWITHEVQRMCKKKQILYNKAKKSQRAQDWKEYKELQKATQKKQRQNYWTYQNSMFDGDKSNKSFWRFIKSKKQDSTNITSLKSGSKVIFDSKGKANIFNEQFCSVFTTENTSDIPKLDEPPYTQM